MARPTRVFNPNADAGLKCISLTPSAQSSPASILARLHGRERTSHMALLIVAAASEDTIANPGNRQPNYIEVSVTDANGEPATGLTASNFKVDPMIVGPGGALVNITGVTAGRLPGFYNVNVVPIRTETWKAGGYIFAVAVERGKDKGQTLAAVLMD
jgi:hypothetical protein